MVIKLATSENINYFLEGNAKVDYGVRKDIIESIISSNTALVLDNEGKIEGCAAMAVSLSPKTLAPVVRCFLIYCDSVEHTKTLLEGIRSMYSNVALSRDCMRYCKLNLKGDGNWYSYKIEYANKLCSNRSVISAVNYSQEHLNIFNVVDKATSCSSNNGTSYFGNNLNEIKKLESMITDYGSGVYSFPVLSNAMVRKILAFEKNAEYKVNDSEVYDVQIPEILLEETNRDLYVLLSNMFATSICPIAKSLYMYNITSLTSIQLAKYEPHNVSAGNWHFDEDSNVTLVINLSKDVVCEGTVIKPFGSKEEIIIPVLPVGHGLLFRGSVFQHKGLEVEKGARKILVFWSV